MITSVKQSFKFVQIYRIGAKMVVRENCYNTKTTWDIEIKLSGVIYYSQFFTKKQKTQNVIFPSEASFSQSLTHIVSRGLINKNYVYSYC